MHPWFFFFVVVEFFFKKKVSEKIFSFLKAMFPEVTRRDLNFMNFSFMYSSILASFINFIASRSKSPVQRIGLDEFCLDVTYYVQFSYDALIKVCLLKITVFLSFPSID